MQHKKYKKVVLVVLDGFGVASPSRGNAISLVPTPNFDFLVDNFPSLTLQASGPLVGLPWGEVGNSEVGHLNLGAGRIVAQDLPRITNAVQDESFFKNPAFLAAIEHVKRNGSSLHLAGLVSGGGVHSLDEHLYALLGLAAEQELPKVYIHVFTDGRDTAEKVALDSLKKLEGKISEIGVGKIATVTGRFYAMDRGGHWNQTWETYQAMVEGRGFLAVSAEDYILKNYQNQIFDEMLRPAVLMDRDSHPVGVVKENDALIFFNFRQDRALQLTQMFSNPESIPEGFRPQLVPNLFVVTMTEYKAGLKVQVAFPPQELKATLPEVLSQAGLTQLHMAESEKYAHVTSFFNGGKSEQCQGEERLIVKSPGNNIRNYVDAPQMSAMELTDTLVERITKSEINFFLANYANADMVGHTGSLEAAKQAVRVLDECLGKLVKAALLVDAALIVTADHGNVERMINLDTGEIDKDHTTNPVPLLVAANEMKFKTPCHKNLMSLVSEVPAGVISDVAPTVLDLFALAKPQDMTGINLLDEVK